MVVWFGGRRDFGRKSPRSTPYFAETGRLRGDFHYLRLLTPSPHCQDHSWQRFFRWFLRHLPFRPSSRIRMRPSPSGISSGCQVALTPSPTAVARGAMAVKRLRRTGWSKLPGSAPVGSLSWLNQFRPGSSSGIHSLMACQGGSMGSMV